MQRSRNNNELTVAIELSRSRLTAVIVHDVERGERRVRQRQITWREQAQALHSEVGRRELTTALKSLVASERLAGRPIRITLSGDFCVTRVAAGESSRVAKEMEQLVERSAFYLSLGAGPKAHATSSRQLDARHEQAFVSVVNERTLETLLAVAEECDLAIERIEPSLVALCRCVGAMGVDAEAPALVINLTEGGVELGISHRGHLILDYRPGGREAQLQAAAILTRHFDRLQRYCDRHYRFAIGKMQRAFICGPVAAASELCHALKSHPTLRVELLDAVQVDKGLTFDTPPQDGTVCPPLGTCLSIGGADLSGAPNLLTALRVRRRAATPRELSRLLWPVAAALLFGLGAQGAAWWQRQHANDVQTAIDALQPERTAATRLRGDLTRYDQEIVQRNRLRQAIVTPAMAETATLLAQCLPEQVWLDRLAWKSATSLTLTGTSYDDQGVFQLVRHLREAPGIASVALEGTNPTQFRSGYATSFDIACQLAKVDGEPVSAGKEAVNEGSGAKFSDPVKLKEVRHDATTPVR